MSLTSSPQHDISALFGRRQVATIPKDQQKILEKDGSWAVEESQRQGVPQVPSHVLETITETYLRRRKREPQGANNLTETVLASVVKEDVIPEEGTGDRKPQEQVDSERHGSDEENEDSPPSSLAISWEESPPRDHPAPKFTPAPPIESQAVEETPMTNPRNEGQTSHPLDFHAHVREDDDEDEDEMDTELPQANEQTDARVNLEPARAQPTATPAMDMHSQSMQIETPPCAQPNQNIIPGTVNIQKPADEKPEDRQKRQRFKPIRFEGTTPVKPVSASTSFTRLPNTLHITEVDSSLSTSSSSLIPATCATASTQNTAIAPIPQASHAETHITIVESQPASIHREISPPDTSNPYTLFITVYPDYKSNNGTLKNFIKACLCLDYLESERALRECLYDDFIRAFAAGYLKYVLSAGEGQQPLPAIEWFNMLEGQPEYTLMVMTRENLRTVLGMFPEEVAKARRYISHEAKDKAVETKKRHRTEDRMDIDVQTPDMSPPGPARSRRRHSPQLGSDAPVHPPVPASSSRSRGARASQYFERMASFGKSSTVRKRSAEEQARLREHFLRRKTGSGLSSGSRHGST